MSETRKQPIVSVFGGATPRPDTPVYVLARRLGELLAHAGWTVATGGYGGVMEGVSRGAAEAGGHVIGVTCSYLEARWPQRHPNAWVQTEIRLPTLRERMAYLVECCDAALALPGGVGTLSEIALVWALLQAGEIASKPLVVIGPEWGRIFEVFLATTQPYLRPGDASLLQSVATVEAAVELIGRH